MRTFGKNLRDGFHISPAPYGARANSSAGFTLVEMVVAVALFSVVMIISVSSLLSLVNANRKAQALQSVINNLNIAIDGMVRTARMGNSYDGSSSCSSNSDGGPKDCTGGSTVLAFEPFGNASADPPWVYSYAHDGDGVGRIYKSENGQTPIAITAPEVSIDDMRFFVVGTTRGDTVQPKVVIVIKGTAGAAGTSARTTFHIQATAVQRLLDI